MATHSVFQLVALICGFLLGNETPRKEGAKIWISPESFPDESSGTAAASGGASLVAGPRGFGARARVLAINGNERQTDERPAASLLINSTRLGDSSAVVLWQMMSVRMIAAARPVRGGPFQGR